MKTIDDYKEELLFPVNNTIPLAYYIKPQTPRIYYDKNNKIVMFVPKHVKEIRQSFNTIFNSNSDNVIPFRGKRNV